MSAGFTLLDFIRESNRIEGISRPATADEIGAHEYILSVRQITPAMMIDFVDAVAPGKPLRLSPGMNVRVGNHIAPPGGPDIGAQLCHILANVRHGDSEKQCYAVHQQYESLHPFMDGNGRSGRIIWLWMMGGIERAPLGFLHHWYYQSLAAR